MALNGSGAHEPRQAAALDFRDGPGLELDQQLTQLVGRAEDVIATQGRLRGLLAANKMINGAVELPPSRGAARRLAGDHLRHAARFVNN